MRRAFVLAFALPAALALSCMDDNGNAVDWFAMIKYPDGTSYSYADSNDGTFQTSANTVDSTTAGALANTLNPMFQSSWALYNDEPPTGTAGDEFGHTKGVIGLSTDASTGFWLLHSVPKFPSETSGSYDGYPSSGETYGQSFLCVSLNGGAFPDVADLLRLTRPKFYDVSLSPTVVSKLPELNAVCNNGDAWLPAASNVTRLQSTGGNMFTYFAKNAAWGEDIYGNLVGPTYQADIWAETWQNGANPLPNFCTPTHPYNTMNIENFELNGQSIKNTKDHSKWAIIIGQDDVCIGGINRMQSQEARPGGTMCFVSAPINKALNANAQAYNTPPKGACG